MNYPVIFVIFGATGDLAERKLFPALFGLYCRGLLPARFKIVAFARRPFTDESFRKNIVTPSLHTASFDEKDESTEAKFRNFLEKIVYHQGNFDEEKPYITLINRLGEIDKALGACSHKIFHLAVSPFFYETLLARMEASGLNLSCTDGTGATRVLIEKPIGVDLKSAHRIDESLDRIFQEQQIFRVDHYLMKNALYDLLTVRFSHSPAGKSLARSLAQSLTHAWDGDAIESIRLFLFEKITAEGRGVFYDKIGAVRDVGQNHLLEMFALLLAEKMPTSADRDKCAYRAAALAGLAQAEIGNTAKCALKRAHYEGYLAEEGVAPDSQTETYFQIPFSFKKGLWKSTDFTLESGKGLARSQAGVSIVFRRPIGVMIGAPVGAPIGERRAEVSAMTLTVQPNPSVEFTLSGGKKEVVSHAKLFSPDGKHPDNYERVYFDALRDDQTRFVGKEEVDASWAFIDRARAALAKTPLGHYQVGSLPL